MTMKERGLDFCGLWRQGKGEVHEFLMQVVSWRIGCSADNDYVNRFDGRPDKLWLRAEVIKYKEGSIYPKVFEIVLPRKNFRFIADTFYNNSCIYGEKTKFFVEFSGNIYGPSPLLHEMPIAEIEFAPMKEKIEAAPMGAPGANAGWVRRGWEEAMDKNKQHLAAKTLTAHDQQIIQELHDLNGFQVPECVVNESPTFVSRRALERAVESITACEKKEKGVE